MKTGGQKLGLKTGGFRPKQGEFDSLKEAEGHGKVVENVFRTTPCIPFRVEARRHQY